MGRPEEDTFDRVFNPVPDPVEHQIEGDGDRAIHENIVFPLPDMNKVIEKPFNDSKEHEQQRRKNSKNESATDYKPNVNHAMAQNGVGENQHSERVQSSQNDTQKYC